MGARIAVKCPRCGKWHGTAAIYSSNCPYCGKIVNHEKEEVMRQEPPEGVDVPTLVRALNGGGR